MLDRTHICNAFGTVFAVFLFRFRQERVDLKDCSESSDLQRWSKLQSTRSILAQQCCRKIYQKTKMPTYWLESLKGERYRGRRGTFKVNKKVLKEKYQKYTVRKRRGRSDSFASSRLAGSENWQEREIVCNKFQHFEAGIIPLKKNFTNLLC